LSRNRQFFYIFSAKSFFLIPTLTPGLAGSLSGREGGLDGPEQRHLAAVRGERDPEDAEDHPQVSGVMAGQDQGSILQNRLGQKLFRTNQMLFKFSNNVHAKTTDIKSLTIMDDNLGF
jgi:hypothetical protein